MILVGGVLAAWPNPVTLIPIALGSFVILSLVAFLFDMAAAHLLALPCLALAYAVGMHLIAGRHRVDHRFSFDARRPAGSLDRLGPAGTVWRDRTHQPDPFAPPCGWPHVCHRRRRHRGCRHGNLDLQRTAANPRSGLAHPDLCLRCPGRRVGLATARTFGRLARPGVVSSPPASRDSSPSGNFQHPYLLALMAPRHRRHRGVPAASASHREHAGRSNGTDPVGGTGPASVFGAPFGFPSWR